MTKFRLFGGGKERQRLDRCREWARVANQAEDDVRRRSDAELKGAISSLRQRHQSGESLDALLPETFAIVREAAVRTLGERPYDEQLIGGAALHLGSVVEMKTGEGKTLTAVLPACLHALADRGVHVLTANDYLVARDADWMGPVYQFLGLRSTALRTGASRAEKQDTYKADIVYGTPFEFACDYLRDNLVHEPEKVVQRGRFSAIVDEADLVMLDDGGLLPNVTMPADVASEHVKMAKLAARLEPGRHYTIDEARRLVTPTELGMAVVEDWFGAAVYSGDDVSLARGVSLALRAKELYVKDRDYVVVEGTVRIVDKGTQRVVADRALGEGLDQALDAKEGVDVRPARQMIAAIDTHAYLGLYGRLAGMTGVVEGEVAAYRDLYGLECVIVPPHRPIRRIDREPVIYIDDATMLRAMAKTVEEKRSAGRPVLIGTASDEMATRISQKLAANDIAHDVLAARNHEFEAEIIARAGRPGAVTVLARMAGRGIDIRLAEPDGAGLFVLGLGPLTSRRLELHLRGRAGRGGDPGESAFFFSFEDPYLHTPKSVERLSPSSLAEEPFSGRLLTWPITAKLNHLSAYETEKLARILRYSAVQEEQRAAVYAMRDDVLRNGVARDRIIEIVEKVQPDTDAREAVAARESELGADIAAKLAQQVMLSVIDRAWSVQLRDLEDAHDALGLRTVAGGDPFTEYRRAAAQLAAKMWDDIEEQFAGYWFNVKVEVSPLDGEESEDE